MLSIVSHDVLSNVTLIITAFITGVLSPLVASWARSKFTAQKDASEADEILTFLHNNEVIDNRLDVLRKEYNFDRVWIAQFHNGGAFYPSERIINKFQKFSLTYESCKPGISSEISNIQNIPVSVFSSVLKRVKENNFFCVNDLSAEKDENTVLKSFWTDRGVKGFHIFAIKCLKGKFIGFMVIDCVSDCTPFSSDLIQSMVVETKVLAGYLVKDSED